MLNFLKYMLALIIGVAFGFFVLNTSSEVVSPAPVIYNSDTIPNKIPFIKYNNSMAFVKVKVKGKDAVFLVDTGAKTTVVDIAQAESYGLSFEELFDIELSGVGGKTALYGSMQPYHIDTDQGQFKVTFMASDLGNVVETFRLNIGIRILGILGSDFFSNYNFIIDYKDRSMYSLK